jgi:hypothetical protein
MDSQLHRLLGTFMTPEQFRQFTLATHQLPAWWAGQGVGGRMILSLVLFALVGVFFTFVRVFFTKMPSSDRHAVAQERVNEEIRRRHQTVRQARY